jgi:hypothetical protein
VPSDQRLARRREPLLDQLTALGLENGGPEDRLVDVDRGQHMTSRDRRRGSSRSSPAHSPDPLIALVHLCCAGLTIDLAR